MDTQTPPPRRKFQFGIGTLLIIVAAVALLFAQRPYLQMFPVAVVVRDGKAVGEIGPYIPSLRLVGVLLAELFAAFLWWRYVRKNR